MDVATAENRLKKRFVRAPDLPVESASVICSLDIARRKHRLVGSYRGNHCVRSCSRVVTFLMTCVENI